MIKLSKPVYVTDDLTTDDIEIRIQKYDGSFVDNFDVDFQTIQELPTQTLYVRLSVHDFLQGDERSSKVTAIYKRSGKIFDTELIELTDYT